MKQLQDMGFDEASVSVALSMNNQNVDNALAMLLGQQSHEQAEGVPQSHEQARGPPPPFPLAPLGAAHRQPSWEEPSDPALDALAAALAADRAALDALHDLVQRLARGDTTAGVLQLSGTLASVKAAAGGAGLAFLQELGYTSRSGFWVRKAPSGGGVGPAGDKLGCAAAAIRRAMGDASYQEAEAFELSVAEAWSDASEARHMLRQRPPRAEPTPPLPLTRLVFHFEGSEDAKGNAFGPTLERKFAPDDLLCDVMHFIGSLDPRTGKSSSADSAGPPETHSWELVETTGSGVSASTVPPFWWCHGLELADVTTRPARTFTLGDAAKTLQALELWPSAQVRVRPLALAPASPGGRAAAKSAARGRASGGGSGSGGSGQALGGVRPSTKEVLASVTTRHGPALTGPSAGEQKREHFAIGAGPAGSGISRAEQAARAAAAAEARSRDAAPGAPAGTAVPAAAAAAAAAPPAALPASAPTAATAAAQAAAGASSGGAVAELVGMGFNEAKARAALAEAGGNTELAVTILLR